MPLQHYLPATYIACFSRGQESRRRDRIVVVGDRIKGKVRKSKAGRIGGINNLYSDIVDNNWQFYEHKLSNAISELIAGTIDAETWGRIIVPFVAGLLVRGPDFKGRYAKRLGELADVVHPSSFEMARIFEFQYLLSKLLSSDWMIARTAGEGDLIANDLGYAPFAIANTNKRGISVPIGLDHLIQIIPNNRSPIAILRSDQWIPYLKYVVLAPNNHLEFNKTLAEYSQHYIFGSTKSAIRRYLNTKNDIQEPLEPFQIGFMPGGGDETKYSWYKFISMVSAEKDDPSHNQFNTEAYVSGPIPSIMFLSSELENGKPLVYRKGNIIFIDHQANYNLSD